MRRARIHRRRHAASRILTHTRVDRKSYSRPIGNSRGHLPLAAIGSAGIVGVALRRGRPTYGRWPWAAALLAPPVTAVALAKRDRLNANGATAIWASLPLLLWHQTEEWILPGGFLPWFNREVWKSGQDDFPVTPKIGFRINVAAGWGVSLAAALGIKRAPWLACGVLASHAGNGMLHIREAAVNRRYNPGLATALVLAPLGTGGTIALFRRPEIPSEQAIAGIAQGMAVSGGLLAFLRHRAKGATDARAAASGAHAAMSTSGRRGP